MGKREYINYVYFNGLDQFFLTLLPKFGNFQMLVGENVCVSFGNNTTILFNSHWDWKFGTCVHDFS